MLPITPPLRIIPICWPTLSKTPNLRRQVLLLELEEIVCEGGVPGPPVVGPCAIWEVPFEIKVGRLGRLNNPTKGLANLPSIAIVESASKGRNPS